MNVKHVRMIPAGDLWRWEVLGRNIEWSGLSTTFERAARAASDAIDRLNMSSNEEEGR